MDITEITGYFTGVSKEGVNFLQPSESFQDLFNGFIYRQVLQSRYGFVQFADQLGIGEKFGGGVATPDASRVMGIFENYLRDNTTQLLVCSKNYLYIYSKTANSFQQIPNNSAVAFVNFGITSNEDYVSGTTYPFPDGSNRFVFTGKGMSDVYFFNGTDVKRFFNAVDNPIADPTVSANRLFSGGTINRAVHVKWFGERLNFFHPTIAGNPFPQGILYSGIRDTAGRGDAFNVPGSGLLQADTPQFMATVEILGNKIAMSFSRSTWALDKTTDAFNPYLIREIPSVLGTESDFSSAAYGNLIEAMGQTGLIVTDAREEKRIDNKIPFFCRDKISTENMQLIYGGFDRYNSQFMFSYLDDENPNDLSTQDRVLVHNYEENTWSVNTQRFSVFGQTLLGEELPWDSIDNIVSPNHPEWVMWDTTEDIWNKIGVSNTEQKTLAGDDLGFVYQLDVGFDDYFYLITNITSASSAVITVGIHAFLVGDLVTIDHVDGLIDINGTSLVNGVTATVTVVAATTITVNINTDIVGVTPYVSGGDVSKVIEFSALLQPFNPYRAQGIGCHLLYVDFLLDTDSGFLLVDFFSDEEESPWKSNVLLQPDTEQKSRQWIRVSVNHDADFHTIQFRQPSVTEQVKLTSIRLYHEPGDRTYA